MYLLQGLGLTAKLSPSEAQAQSCPEKSFLWNFWGDFLLPEPKLLSVLSMLCFPLYRAGSKAPGPSV